LILGNAERDRLTAGEEPGGAGRFPIDADELVGDEAGGLSPGEAELIGQEAIQALGLRGKYTEFDRAGGRVAGCGS
jgi:hypothetical protein